MVPGQPFGKPRFSETKGAAPRPASRLDRKSSPNLMAGKLAAEASSGGGEGGAATTTTSQNPESSSSTPPRSAVGMAWEAFKGNGGGDSLAVTVKAAVTATTIAVEHVRKRTRERLLEKGAGGGGKRLSGPVQITLEDLQVRRWWRRWWWWCDLRVVERAC